LDTLFKINRSIMAHNPIDVVGPSAQRRTHFDLISSKVVNASDPRAMAANVVENRFDDVGKHPQPISHHRGGGAPKIMQPPIGQRLRLHAGICRLLTCREYARIKRSLRLRPTREAAMAIALPARALSEDMFPALAAKRDQCDRGISEGNGVLAMIFAPGAGDGPTFLSESSSVQRMPPTSSRRWAVSMSNFSDGPIEHGRQSRTCAGCRYRSLIRRYLGNASGDMAAADEEHGNRM
jgi:hypothetical protein